LHSVQLTATSSLCFLFSSSAFFFFFPLLLLRSSLFLMSSFTAAPVYPAGVSPQTQMVSMQQQPVQGAVYPPGAPPQQSMNAVSVNPGSLHFGSVQLGDGSNASRLLYHAQADPEGIKCLHCLQCVCNEAATKEIIANHYVQVWDNRLVISEPGMVPFVLGCCNKVWWNNVSAIPLDDPVMAETYNAKCCSPCGLPPKVLCCPTNALVFCGFTGEALLLREKEAPCCAGCCSCECWSCKCCEIAKVGTAWFGRRYVFHLKDVTPLIAAIDQAKAARGLTFEWKSLYNRMHK